MLQASVLEGRLYYVRLASGVSIELKDTNKKIISVDNSDYLSFRVMRTGQWSEPKTWSSISTPLIFSSMSGVEKK
jgi:hypothetical protein